MTQPDTTQLRADVEQAQATNDAALQQLAQQGVQIDPATILGTRVGELTQHLLGDMDDPRRLAFEQTVQDRYTMIIADIHSQLARAKLMAGVNGAQLPTNGLTPR